MKPSSPKEYILSLAEKRSAKRKDEEFRKMEERILGIWSDPNHALIELIQNADDAKAKEATFILTKRSLIFLHDGKPFSRSDVKHICSVALTTKKIGSYIGFLGIGFKSVFKITHQPHVFSSNFKFFFKREEPTVPKWVERIPQEASRLFKEKLTMFYLPLREDIPTKTRENIEKSLLEELKPLSLAFLRSLRKLSFEVLGETRHMAIKKGRLRGHTIRKGKIVVTEEVAGVESVHNFLLLTKLIPVVPRARADYSAKENKKAGLKELSVALAFLLDKKGHLSSTEGQLFTFLPTSVRTGLAFVLNSDFILNTSRDDLDWSSEWNVWLLAEIGLFLKETAEIFKSLKKFKRDFYGVLPRKQSVSDKFTEYLVNPVLDFCKKNPIVLTSENKWSEPAKVVFASRSFQKLFPPQTTGYQHYVHPDIRGKDFLMDIGVAELDEKTSILKILKNSEFLSAQNKKWFRRVYEYLNEQLYTLRGWGVTHWKMREIEDELKEAPFVLTSDGKLATPNQALVPPKNRKKLKEIEGLPIKALFIDPFVITGKTKNLLLSLGCHSTSRESLIRTLLKGFEEETCESWTREGKISTLCYLKDWLRTRKWAVPDDLKAEIGLVRIPTADDKWKRADRCYFPDNDLDQIIHGPFVDMSIFGVERYNEWRRFLVTIGVTSYPRIIVFQGRFDRWKAPSGILEEKWKKYWDWLPSESSTSSREVENPCVLDGFQSMLEAEDSRRAKRYLRYLISNWAKYYSDYSKNQYHWFYYYRKQKSVPSFFAFTIMTESWLPTNQGLKTPSKKVFVPTKEIVKVAGHLATYLDLSSMPDLRSEGFFELLGLTTKVDLNALVSLLLKAKESLVDDTLLQQLERIYSSIPKHIGEIELNSAIELLAHDNMFVSSDELYWNDDREMGDLFRDELRFVWVPPNISQPDLEAIFKFFRVEKLSESITRKLVSNIEGATIHELEEVIKKKRNLVYSILSNFQAKRLAEAQSFLSSAHVRFLRDLVIQLSVNGTNLSHTHRAFCDLEENTLWVSDRAKHIDVSIELARSFGLALDRAFYIDWVLSEDDESLIINNLRRFNIPIIPLREGEEVCPLPFVEESVDQAKIERLKVEMENASRSEKTGVTREPDTLNSKVETLDQRIEASSSPHTEETKPKSLMEEQSPRIEVNFDTNEIEKEINEAKKLLASEVAQGKREVEVWSESKEVESVTGAPRVVVRPFVSISTRKDWKPMILDGEKVYVDVEIDKVTVESVRKYINSFRQQMCEIVKIMGGNPETVNICIANPNTDGDRREGQLFFNVLRDDSHIRWLIVAARELAYTKIPKLGFPQISLWTDLIAKAFENFDKICFAPERDKSQN